jgi:hypothetical protein
MLHLLLKDSLEVDIPVFGKCNFVCYTARRNTTWVTHVKTHNIQQTFSMQAYQRYCYQDVFTLQFLFPAWRLISYQRPVRNLLQGF